MAIFTGELAAVLGSPEIGQTLFPLSTSRAYLINGGITGTFFQTRKKSRGYLAYFKIF
nr:hypothetical protein [uncultured Oscillibacter sp.]